MHIAQVIDNLIIGGAQKWLVTFVQAAQAQSDVGETEYTVTIISLAREHSASLKLELESFGANIEIFPFERVANIKQLFLLYRFIKLANFDIIQTHLIRAKRRHVSLCRMPSRGSSGSSTANTGSFTASTWMRICSD